jgi:putative ABC transport system permease protein
MSEAPRPPRFARWILARLVPRDVRDSIDGDLCELFAERRERRGAPVAHVMYWRDALTLAMRFTADRLRRFAVAMSGGNGVPSALDFKLGGRMLLKYPGLAIVGGFGMAIATAIGAGGFAFFNVYLYPDLPLHDGERIVSIANWNTRTRDNDPRILHDFVAWRRDLKSIVDVAAFRTSRRNLIGPSGEGEPVTVAEMSAAGFRIARVSPLVGRTLIDSDERPDATPVIVIGHDVWRDRFGADPSVVGGTIRVGRLPHTIVGVMPDGFAFPINHRYWMPLRADPNAYEFGKGPELKIFGRIAPGFTKEEAQAELAVIGQRAAAEHPQTHARLQPRIFSYTDMFADGESDGLAASLAQTVLTLLLVIVCANVAILVYARTVTRSGEIVVRTALGATRARIVTQLFAEAFVLSLLSAAAGLGIVVVGLRYADQLLATMSEGGAPFWIEPGLSTSTILYALGLAVLGAVIVGVLPALRATGRQLRAGLADLSGGSRARLGRTWTFLVVAQVAITVAALPPVIVNGKEFVVQATRTPQFASEEFLATAMLIEREGNAFADIELRSPEFVAAMRTAQSELTARLAAEPGVAGVTFADVVPGFEWFDRIEVAGQAMTNGVRATSVGSNFFDVFGVTLAAGRHFTVSDAELEARRPVIVNRSFVDEVLGGAEAVGQRVRSARAQRDAQWNTIVGVVDGFPAGIVPDLEWQRAKLYHLAVPGEMQGATLFVRLRGQAPLAFAPAFRRIATEVDPTIQLRRLRPLDADYAKHRRDMAMSALALVGVTGSVLLLSMAGMYAMMSFTVNQRRREIGVRSALGADARRILTGILSRTIRQLALGVGIGLGLCVVVDRLTGGGLFNGNGLVVVPGVALFMALVGLLAAVGPARRGLSVQPTEALRSE